MKCEYPTCVLEYDHKSGHRNADGRWFWELIIEGPVPPPLKIPHEDIKIGGSDD